MIEKDTPCQVHFVAVIAAIRAETANKTVMTLSDGKHCLRALITDSDDTQTN